MSDPSKTTTSSSWNQWSSNDLLSSSSTFSNDSGLLWNDPSLSFNSPSDINKITAFYNNTFKEQQQQQQQLLLNDYLLASANYSFQSDFFHSPTTPSSASFNISDESSTQSAEDSNNVDNNWQVFFLLIVEVAGVIGNLLVVISVIIERKLRTITNYILVSLAIADLLVSLVVMPGYIAQEYKGFWAFGLVTCTLWQMSDVTMCTSSIMHMCIISLDRYKCIRDPMSLRNRSKRSVAFRIAAVWIFAISISSPLTLLATFRPLDILNSKSECIISNPNFLVYGSIAAFFLPLVVMLLTYSLTIRLLSQKAKELEKSGGLRRTVSKRRLQTKRLETTIRHANSFNYESSNRSQTPNTFKPNHVLKRFRTVSSDEYYSNSDDRLIKNQVKTGSSNNVSILDRCACDANSQKTSLESRCNSFANLPNVNLTYYLTNGDMKKQMHKANTITLLSNENKNCYEIKSSQVRKSVVETDCYANKTSISNNVSGMNYNNSRDNSNDGRDIASSQYTNKEPAKIKMMNISKEAEHDENMKQLKLGDISSLPPSLVFTTSMNGLIIENTKNYENNEKVIAKNNSSHSLSNPSSNLSFNEQPYLQWYRKYIHKKITTETSEMTDIKIMHPSQRHHHREHSSPHTNKRNKLTRQKQHSTRSHDSSEFNIFTQTSNKTSMTSANTQQPLNKASTLRSEYATKHLAVRRIHQEEDVNSSAGSSFNFNEQIGNNCNCHDSKSQREGTNFDQSSTEENIIHSCNYIVNNDDDDHNNKKSKNCLTFRIRLQSFNRSSTASASSSTTTNSRYCRNTNNIRQQQQHGSRLLLKTFSSNSSSKNNVSSNSTSKTVNNERKAVKVLGLMFLMFVVCWFVFFCVNFAMGVCPQCKFDESFFKYVLWLGYTSSLINPIIYTVFNPSFRSSFLRILTLGYCAPCVRTKSKL